MFGAHIGPVTASAPALGTISSVPVSLATLAIAIATPRVHRADEHVDVVALDQLVDVVGGLGRVALVVDLDELDLAAAELAALLRHVAAEAVLDRRAERGEGAGGRQHQADLELGRACAWAASGGEAAAAAARAMRLERSWALSPGGVRWTGMKAAGGGDQRRRAGRGAASGRSRAVRAAAVCGTRRAMPRICSSVPYSSSRPCTASSGQRMVAISSSIDHCRNGGCSQMWFQPQKAESGSSW